MKLTKEQRTDLAWEEYLKIEEPALEEYKKKCDEIDAEPEEVEKIIEHNGRKYKLEKND